MKYANMNDQLMVKYELLSVDDPPTGPPYGDAAVTASGTIRLDTDESWRTLVSEAWQRDVPSGSLGFIEIYDARKAPQDWTGAAFDDADWQPAEVLRVRGRNSTADVTPFPFLEARDIPPLVEKEIHPQKVVRYGEVDNAPDASTPAVRIEQEMIQPLQHCRLIHPETLLEAQATAEIVTTDKESVTVVLDFGGVVCGRIRFELEGPAGAQVAFTYGERLQEDGRVKIAEGIPGFDVPYVHRYTTRAGRQSWEQFEWAGFRYVQATFRRCRHPLRIHQFAVNTVGYPVKERGFFRCSDALLTRIWQVGADTVRLEMHDGYDDCPTREQRQWVGDGYVQMLVSFAAFGDAKLAARFLRQIARSQRPNGLTTMAAPGDFSVASFSNIPDFCLYWILSAGRYVQYAGDKAMIDELYPYMVRALTWFERLLNEESLLTEVPHWVFIDWAELDKTGQVAALNAQFVAALRTVAGFARKLGHENDGQRYASLAGQVAEAINRLFWDEARGVYVDARQDGKLSRRVSQQTNAAVIAFEIAPKERWQKIFATILDEKRLVLTRAWDLETTEVPFDARRTSSWRSRSIRITCTAPCAKPAYTGKCSTTSASVGPPCSRTRGRPSGRPGSYSKSPANATAGRPRQHSTSPRKCWGCNRQRRGFANFRWRHR